MVPAVVLLSFAPVVEEALLAYLRLMRWLTAVLALSPLATWPKPPLANVLLQQRPDGPPHPCAIERAPFPDECAPPQLTALSGESRRVGDPHQF